MAHLAAHLQLPLLLVARAGLGTINHTLLSVWYARKLGIEVAGVILNVTRPEETTDESVKTNAKMIEYYGQVPVWGTFPWIDEPLQQQKLVSIVREQIKTAHRRENLGEPMRQIFRAVRRLVDEHPEIAVVYPVHLNPAVQEVAQELLGGHDRIQLIDPLDATDFHNFARRAHLILTDSDGVQEEAPSLGVPVLVLRDTTERPEGIAAGTLKLAGTEEAQVYAMAKELLTNQEAYNAMAHAANPYGDGDASRRIVEAILHHFGIRAERPEPFQAGQ